MSDYSGHVEPGGAPARRNLPTATIVKQSVGPMDNNAYLMICSQTREAVLIDAAHDTDKLLALIGAEEATVRAIITTHQHGDHWQALADIAGATGAQVYAGSDDAAALPVPVDVPLAHGDEVRVGDIRLRIIGLRGHTPGSVAIIHDAPGHGHHLFTGDSLFPGGPGRTWSAEDFTTLMDDLETRVFAEFPDDTWVYPGHGDDTTLGAERPHLAKWRARGW